MLNRTNRTLSANLNRLNLGTRSLALKSGVNMGSQALRTRHAHPQAVAIFARAGQPGEIRFPAFGESEVGYPVSVVPGSSPRPPWPTSSFGPRARSVVVAEAEPVGGQVVDDALPCRPDPRGRARMARLGSVRAAALSAAGLAKAAGG